MFGSAIDTDPVRIKRRRFFPFQPANTLMTPMGHLHLHPSSSHYAPDYSLADFILQGLFIHEMTHVWQAQRRGRWFLVAMRHPFCRYDYSIKPGWPLARYGIEQQAEIVRHAFMARHGHPARGSPPAAQLGSILPDEFAR